jgi:hypothetical protein
MTKIEEYKNTTNSSVFRKLHKEIYAHCSYCKWHGPATENGAWDCYSIKVFKDGKEKIKFPSWKLVSKNKKQWMKKNLKFRKSKRWSCFFDEYIFIEWPMKIRPK